MHCLLGEEISPFEWHGVFTAMGLALSPSDALPIRVWMPAQLQGAGRQLPITGRKKLP
jgi:hypothetical protein